MQKQNRKKSSLLKIMVGMAIYCALSWPFAALAQDEELFPNPTASATRIELAQLLTSLYLMFYEEDILLTLPNDNIESADDLREVLEMRSVKNDRVLRLKDISSLDNEDRNTIAVAVETELMTGYPDNLFRPNKTFTRFELAAGLERFLKLAGYELAPAPSNSPYFTTNGGDVDPNHWAASQSANFCYAQLLCDEGDKTFRGGDYATHQDLNRIIENILPFLANTFGEDEDE